MTEQFVRLASLIMKSQNVPDEIAVVVKGNPEFISDQELAVVAMRVLEETVARLTSRRPAT